MNLTTKKVHIDGEYGPQCGKDYPLKSAYLLEFPVNGRPCDKCFR